MAKKKEKEAMEVMIELLAAAAGATNVAKDVEVVRSSDVMQIMIPAKMPLREAIQWLQRKDEQEDKVVALRFEFVCYPLDGVVSFREALAEIYGFVSDVDIPGDFFSPDRPPQMIGVPVGPGKIRQVPWGRLQVPGVYGHLQTMMEATPTPKFILIGQTKQRHLGEIAKIVEKTQENLKTKSIYKGKAVRVDLSWMREFDPGTHDFQPVEYAPQFAIPTDTVNQDDLILSPEVQNDLELGLWTPIEYPTYVREVGTSLKRGVLLAGEPGVGKSLTAYVTAKKAVENGWTFIYLTHPTDLARGFQFAGMYAPAVLFVEDLDRVISGDERTEAIDTVLNSFDGVDTKDKEIITVITTNHLEVIPPVALRPGRFDTLVELKRPDAASAARLVALYGRGLLADNFDLEKVGKSLAGHIPSEVREAVERAKLAAIRRLGKRRLLDHGRDIAGHVADEDVLAAVHAMKTHHALLIPKAKDKMSLLEKAFDVFGERVADGMNTTSDRAAALAMRLAQTAGLSSRDLFDAAGDLSVDDDVDAIAGSVSPNGDE